jgi:hypothetical protein
MHVHRDSFDTDSVIVVGDEGTMDIPVLEEMAEHRGLTIVDRVEIDTDDLSQLGVVTSDPEVCDAIIRAQSMQAGLFLPYPGDLGRPGHVIQLLATCALSDVPVFVGVSAVPWPHTVLPGLSVTDVIGHVAAGWGHFAPTAAGELLTAEMSVYLSDADGGSEMDHDGAIEDDEDDWGGCEDESTPQARAARSRGLRRAVSEMLRAGMTQDEAAVVLNALAVPTMDGRYRWGAGHVADVPPSRDRLTARARRRRSSSHA